MRACGAARACARTHNEQSTYAVNEVLEKSMWSARAQCSQGGGHPRGPISGSEITCNRQVLGTMVGSLSRALVLLSVLASASSLVVGPVARQQLQARPAIRSAPLEPPLMKARLDKERDDLKASLSKALDNTPSTNSRIVKSKGLDVAGTLGPVSAVSAGCRTPQAVAGSTALVCRRLLITGGTSPPTRINSGIKMSPVSSKWWISV